MRHWEALVYQMERCDLRPFHAINLLLDQRTVSRL